MPEEPGGMVLVYSKTTSFYTSAGLKAACQIETSIRDGIVLSMCNCR